MSKTNLGLVEYARAQLGRPYWLGTFGNTATAELLAYKKKQLPGYYTASDFPSQFGQRVHDCVGLIKGYIWSEGPDSPPVYASNGCPDINEAQMYANAKEKGAISTMPDMPGVLVFFTGHVGVYIGGGEVIEARGHAYGVVKTKLAGRGWTKWAKCPYISYVKDEPGKEEEETVTYEQWKDFMHKYRAELQDNDANDYSAQARQWAVDKQIVLGGGALADGSANYMWEDMLSREQMAVMLYRFARFAGLA